MLYDIPLNDVQKNREDHIKRISQNIADYEAMARRNVDIQNLITAGFEAMILHKSMAMDKISGTIDPDTLKKRYSNPEAREARLVVVLSEDAEYQTMMTEQRRLHTEESKNQIAMDVLQQYNRIWMKDLDLLIATVNNGGNGTCKGNCK
jgi:hypothetical protein